MGGSSTRIRMPSEEKPREMSPKLLLSEKYLIKSITYVATGGGNVDIPLPINPWNILGLNPSNALRNAVKEAFKKKTTQTSRQNRVLVSVANHILTSTVSRYIRAEGTNEYFIKDWDMFVLAACGQTKRLEFKITQEKFLHEVDEHGRTLLYIACKSGFYDMGKLLLQMGAPINKCQVDGSSPLHAAAYFGHVLVVGLLLECGAKIEIKNKFGHTALEESDSTEIRNLIKNSLNDIISSLATDLTELELIQGIRLVEFEGAVIAKELVRDPRSLDLATREEWSHIQSTWEHTWHGTRFKHLKSIMQKGLVAAGSNGIQPSGGHISLNRELFGMTNWAAAIFISPSVLYASHAVYSERIVSQREQWCVLVKSYCKPDSYTAHDPTVLGGYDQSEDEPEILEYRVPVVEENKSVVLRVESARNVVVRSLIFIRSSFLENLEMNYEEVTGLLNKY